MKIELHEISIRDVIGGYVDSEENGVIGYDGRLNIRPAFQREFIYTESKQKAVINTIMRDFPLNVMYWAVNDEGNYELLDGQQRTMSICHFVTNQFSVNIDGTPHKFKNLSKSEQDQILDYKLMIYICEGTDKEKLDWFKTINIGSMELKAQELRNAIYSGEWVTKAKKQFSKIGCPAYKIAKDYMNGSTIRQDYFEKVLKWISGRDGVTIEDYMSDHQHDTNCNELWLYFQSVMNWVKVIVPNYRKDMKGLDWGIFYNKYSGNNYDPQQLENRILELIDDEDVSDNSGIYEYLLSGDERRLNIRAFPDKIARAAYERQEGICPKCGKHFEFEEMQADHITPWSRGGHTTPDNCQMLCADCNRRKSNI